MEKTSMFCVTSNIEVKKSFNHVILNTKVALDGIGDRLPTNTTDISELVADFIGRPSMSVFLTFALISAMHQFPAVFSRSEWAIKLNLL